MSNFDSEGACGGGVSDLLGKEEDDAILENLNHFDQFLDTLQQKGTDDISLKHLDRIAKLKDKFVQVVAQTELRDKRDKLQCMVDLKRVLGLKELIVDKLDKDNSLKDSAKLSVRAKKLSEKFLNTDLDSDTLSSNESSNSASFDLFGSGDSSDETESSGSASTKKKNKKKKSRKENKTHRLPKNVKTKDKKVDDDKQTGLELLVSALSKLDGRKVPAQEKFDERTGQDLKRYLKKFESYCESNFRGDRDLWIGQLELHLTGKVLEALKAVRDVNDSYEIVRDKLLEWYGNMKDLRKKKNRSNYEKAQFVKGESLYLYSTRLERLYKVAHPSHNIKTSKSIQEKFQSSIPRSARTLLSSQIMSHKVNNRKITWKLIQQCARYYDLEKEKSHLDQRGANSESEEEIVINVGCEKKYKDVSTQNGQPNRESGRNKTPSPAHPDQTVSYTGMAHHPVNYQSSLQGGPGFQNFGNQLPNFLGNSLGHPTPNRFYRNDIPQDTRYTNNCGANYQAQRPPTPMSGYPRFQRPSPQLVNKTNRCTYCTRIGHSVSECRTKFNCCFWCGSAGHYFRQCPKNNYNFNNRDLSGGGGRGTFGNNRGSYYSNHRGHQHRSHSQTRSPGHSQDREYTMGQGLINNRHRTNSGPGRLN